MFLSQTSKVKSRTLRV